MTAQDHILAWIESSAPHYKRLCEIERFRKADSNNPCLSSRNAFTRAANLVADAYWEMVRCGDASRDDPYTPTDLTLAAALVLLWEQEP